MGGRILGIIGSSVLSLLAAAYAPEAVNLPVKLEVRTALTSRLANIHVSRPHQSVYPFTVTYGNCGGSDQQHVIHHSVAEVDQPDIDRLIWLLPDDISVQGCLSAWSLTRKLVGRSEPLEINKNSRQWIKRRQLDKRASIPMTNSSGIDVEGPWFDGVELLKDKEISTVDITKAKAKRRVPLAASSFGSCQQYLLC